MVMKPAWLENLLGETFFEICGVHENRRKSEKNIYCLSCCRSICPHCLPSHCSHSLLQVRRYIYQDVVRLDEMKKIIDCSYVQPYTINRAKVVFLNQRPQSSRCYKSSSDSCLTCDRVLQDPFHFCCISCKVDHVVLQEEDLSSILYRFDDQSDDEAFSQFEELHMDSSNAMEEEEDDDDDQMTTSNYSTLGHHPFQASSCSSDLRSNISDVLSQESQVVITKKKRSKKRGSGFFPGYVLSLSNRRKGCPQRSPLL